MSIESVISAIVKFAPAVAPLAIKQAQRHEVVIKILKDLKFNPIQPPNDVSGVYAYALVEYGVFKPEPLLKLFREKEIQTAFWREFNADNPAILPQEVEHFLDWNILGDEIRDLKINPRQEFEEFFKIFIDVAKRTRTPAEVLRDRE
ncbi:hypothetical protein [Nostoc sp.]|uniref:hypothetical protein n=1 Tax=Nostoc sp. TaxID=1180 RepID=UPI002FF5FCAC